MQHWKRVEKCNNEKTKWTINKLTDFTKGAGYTIIPRGNDTRDWRFSLNNVDCTSKVNFDTMLSSILIIRLTRRPVSVVKPGPITPKPPTLLTKKRDKMSTKQISASEQSIALNWAYIGTFLSYSVVMCCRCNIHVRKERWLWSVSCSRHTCTSTASYPPIQVRGVPWVCSRISSWMKLCSTMLCTEARFPPIATQWLCKNKFLLKFGWWHYGTDKQRLDKISETPLKIYKSQQSSDWYAIHVVVNGWIQVNDKTECL